MIIVAIIVPAVVMLVIGACLGVSVAERSRRDLCEVCFDADAAALVCRECANRAAGLERAR